jgi:hypothetical protein
MGGHTTENKVAMLVDLKVSNTTGLFWEHPNICAFWRNVGDLQRISCSIYMLLENVHRLSGCG